MTTVSLLTASPYDGTTASAGLGGAVIVVMLLVYVAIMALAIWAYVRVARKAGYSPWWALGAFVPLLNLVVFLVFAFGEWPIERELHDLRSRVAYLESSGGHGQLGVRFGSGGGALQSTPPATAWPSGPSGSLG